MRFMIIRAGLPFLLGIALVTGCAANPPPRTAPESPRVRCLAEPTETGTRPLFFLFCLQSP